ncbi:two-component sensor histidine kinase [Flavobacterium limicola]|uniref:Two-component sensor histidine kinase n=1 Tax=Flavobacterium limicola TaxID=180441 RepID=A0A495S6N7_9FLAO|nr:histidine kinase dimerization/phosphoacceptor domain -containing protein [Flavobacterium limicola]RKS95527.1 two-component sensor histidine kinase [Flavobacterium limicola]
MRQLFFLLVLFNFTVFSQNEYQKSEDSLYFLINNEFNDKDKINHYVALCSIYKNSNSTKLNTCNEKLLEILKKANATKEFGHYYSNIADLLKKSDYQQAVIYAEKANKLFYDYKDWDNYILNSVDYAIILCKNNLIDKSEILLQNTLSIALRKKSKHIAVVYYGFCDLYNGISDYIKALKYAKKALVLEKNSLNKAKIYYIISRIYTSTKNYKRALEYNDLAIKNFKANSIYKINKAKILYCMQRYNEALVIALDYEKSSDKTFDLLNISFLSNCYYKMKNYYLANKYIDKRLKLGFKTRINELECKKDKAKICLALNDIQTAEKYINESLNFLKEDDYFELKIEIYEIKVGVEEKLGDFEKALFFNKKIGKINQINNTNFNNNKLHQLEIDLDVTEKDNKIKNLQIAQLKKQVEINTKTDYIIYISIALFIALVFVLAYIKNYNTIKLKNQIIEDEKSLVKKSLLEKETLLKEIHHRVKNNMQLVISLLKIQVRDSKELSIENFIEVSENRILSMALIHEYLYESENINYVNFEEYVNRLSSSIRGSFSNQSNIKLETQINNSHFNIETAIPLGLIINELVINAFKHAFIGKDQGIIKIILFKEQDLHHLEITDNGIGIDAIAENGQSIGLKIVKLLVSQINGQMQIKKDSGTQFTIQFKTIKNTNE